MKSNALLFFSLLFLSLPVLAVQGLPPGSQFHLTNGTRIGYEECEGSCVFVQTSTGAWGGAGITMNIDQDVDYISNTAMINPLFPSGIQYRIGSTDVFATTYNIRTWNNPAELANVIPAQDCSDATTSCGPFSKALPFFLKANGLEYSIAPNATSQTNEFHLAEFIKQGNRINRYRVTGVLVSRTCPSCGWPNGANVILNLVGRITTLGNPPVINDVSGSYIDQFLTVQGDNLQHNMSVTLNGNAVLWTYTNQNSISVYKGAYVNPVGVVKITYPAGATYPAGSHRYPEGLKSTH